MHRLGKAVAFYIIGSAAILAQTTVEAETTCLATGLEAPSFFSIENYNCQPLEGTEPETGHSPWTHKPHCIKSTSGEDDIRSRRKFCVFTNANFRSGMGMSIITTPAVAARLAAKSDLGKPDNETSGPASTPHLYEAREIAGRGMGLFAKAPIKAGEVVLVDYPSLVVSTDAIIALDQPDFEDAHWWSVLQLPAETRKRLRSLAKSSEPGVDELGSILRTNSIRQSYGNGASHLAILADTARINHDCRPNAFYRLNVTTLAIEVFALRDIAVNEEILFSYIDTFLDDRAHLDRQDLLYRKWNFNCTCSICSSSPTLLALSDARRERIGEVKTLLSNSHGKLPEIMGHTQEILRLYDEEGLVAPRGKYFDIAAYVASQLGNLEETRTWAGLAKAHWEILAGKTSWEAKGMEELRKNPEGHPSWRKGLETDEVDETPESDAI